MAFDRNDSSRANTAYVWFGIARTALPAVRLSSLIRFYERTEQRNDLNRKRASRSRRSKTIFSAGFPTFLRECSNQNADKVEGLTAAVSSKSPII